MSERRNLWAEILRGAGLIAVAMALMAIGAMWFGERGSSDRRAPPSAVSAPAVANAAAPFAAPIEPAAQRAAEAPLEPPPAAPPAPEPAATVPPIEDVVSHALPAVVRVDAGAARGSGFFVGPDTLLTNAHVVGERLSVSVHTAAGSDLGATVETVSRQFDLAILKLPSPVMDQPVIPMASAVGVRPGSEVIVIGSALGTLQNTVTRGIVSGLRETGGALLVQTDAAANPGNSGGPLLDRQGRAIGITTMGYADRQGLNFAVAIDYAKSVLQGGPEPAARPSDPGLADLAPARPSAADERRKDGTEAFERTLGQLARRADSLDVYWRSFVASCYDGRISGTFGRPWFALFDAQAMPGAVAPGCEPAFDEMRQNADAVRADLLAADEAARRADVFPGTRRDLRRRYRLDNPGWTP